MERDRRYDRYHDRDPDRRYDREADRWSDRDGDRRYDRDPDRRYDRDADRRRGREQERRPAPPRRRRKRRSPLSSSMMYLLMVFGISAILAVVGWTMANDVLSLNKDPVTAAITVQEDSDFGTIVNELKDNGSIKYKGLFRLFATVTGGKDKVTAGTYNLNTDMDYRAILSNMGPSSSSRTSKSVTIKEGMTVDQIFALLEKEGISTQAKLQDMAANHNYAFSFLQEIPLGDYHRLEGYLFPDTYDFYTGEDAKYVLNKMLVNFDAKLTDTMREKIWAGGQNISQILTIASMIEKEATSTDRATISSVIYNRLNNPRAGTAGYLQIDATIQYLLPEGEKVDQEAIDTIDSPYNTYKYKGLPPGPIANPGLESILAAMNPESTNYYYYALGNDGQHHFFRSYSEFQNFLNS